MHIDLFLLWFVEQGEYVSISLVYMFYRARLFDTVQLKSSENILILLLEYNEIMFIWLKVAQGDFEVHVS